jgi:hypothetical protein
MDTKDDSSAATADEMRALQKKLSARATNLKMELHDLSEELPLGWEKIPDVAQRAHEAFAALTELRARIAALGA